MVDSNSRRLEAMRDKLLEPMLAAAVFDGFTRNALAEAAELVGETAATAEAAFPDGAASVLTFWSQRADAAAVAILQTDEAKTWRIRDKVTNSVTARLEYLARNKEAARRAAATLALPTFAPLGARLVWRSADAIWRGLGDVSTDFNFYTKRAILSGVISTTTARWLADDDPDFAATRSFLADRIGNVMAFEKAKAQARKFALDPAKLVGALARARYPFR